LTEPVVVPARQRFNTSERSGFEVYLWLVTDADLVAQNGAPQFALHNEPGVCRGFHGWGEKLVPVSPGRFRDEHGQARLLDKRHAIKSVFGKQCDADTCRGNDFALAGQRNKAQFPGQALHQLAHAGPVHPRAQQQEFVPTQTTENVARALAELAQQLPA
jgi:hypothetical protein